MRAILTSSLGGSVKVDGSRIPSPLLEDNGLTRRLREVWRDDAKVMIVCASPNDFEKNDSVCACMREAFPMSGLSVSYLETCDDRNEELAERIMEMDVIILTGGHVPTQNKFLKQIRLRERLRNFKGLLIAWSAGSMNCAANVYAGPELEGEALDPDYERWMTGLGITEINIYPHYQHMKDEYLDGLRIMEDITYQDSFRHEILALNDGSWLMIEDGAEILFGEAYLIRNGSLKQICRDGEFVVLNEYSEDASGGHRGGAGRNPTV